MKIVYIYCPIFTVPLARHELWSHGSIPCDCIAKRFCGLLFQMMSCNRNDGMPMWLNGVSTFFPTSTMCFLESFDDPKPWFTCKSILKLVVKIKHVNRLIIKGIILYIFAPQNHNFHTSTQNCTFELPMIMQCTLC